MVLAHTKFTGSRKCWSASRPGVEDANFPGIAGSVSRLVMIPFNLTQLQRLSAGAGGGLRAFTTPAAAAPPPPPAPAAAAAGATNKIRPC